MLILPPGHGRSLAAPRRLKRREKWILSSVLAAVAALTLAVVIAIATAEHTTGNGCIDVKFPIAIGGQELYDCGTSARALCAAVGTPGATNGVAARAVSTECRRVGLRVGR